MTEISKRIREELFEMQDVSYRDFHAKLIPTVEKEYIIGVRTPQLRKYAKRMAKEPGIQDFLNDVPHRYYDENNLHMFIVEQIKDYDTCIDRVEAFLPYVDNWATCDMGAPKVFAKHTEELLDRIKAWLASDHTYTIRYGIGMLMRLYLDDEFKPEYPVMVSELRSEEYYVNMMIAWYFATALAKQYDEILPFIENRRLDVWTHNKAIQKACESYRITPEQKGYLKTLKMKK